MVIKIIWSCIAFLLLLDVIFNLFAGRRASDITGALCSPLFGILYPHVNMITGLFIWLIEVAVIISAVWLWI